MFPAKRRQFEDHFISQVQRGEQIYCINESTKKQIEFTPWEAWAFYYAKGKTFQDFWIPGNITQPSSLSQTGKTALETMRTIPSGALITLTDSTTLRNAKAVTEGRNRPELILDFATLTYLCVMYDVVLVGVAPHEIPKELTDFVIPIDLLSKSSHDPRYDIAAEIANLPREGGFFDKLNRNWSTFLNKEITIDYRHVDTASNSPVRNLEYLPGISQESPISALMSTNYAQDAYQLDSIVSIHTWRYFINEKIAETFNCSYNCTSLRYPVEQVALKSKIQYRWLADELIDRVTEGGQRLTNQDLENAILPHISLPCPFSLVVHRAKNKEELWAEILELRESFKVVRSAIRECKNSEMSDWQIVRDTLKHFEIKGKIPATIDGTLQKTSSIAGAISMFSATATAGLKVASVLAPAELLYKTLTALRRPEIRFLKSFQREIRNIDASIGALERLLGKGINRKWIEVAAHMNEFGSLNASALKVD